MYTVYKCHFRFHFSIRGPINTAMTFRESSIFPALTGGWRVPYERLGRLASIQNTIPKTSSHQCSFWEETAHYFGVGMG